MEKRKRVGSKTTAQPRNTVLQLRVIGLLQTLLLLLGDTLRLDVGGGADAGADLHANLVQDGVEDIVGLAVDVGAAEHAVQDLVGHLLVELVPLGLHVVLLEHLHVALRVCHVVGVAHDADGGAHDVHHLGVGLGHAGLGADGARLDAGLEGAGLGVADLDEVLGEHPGLGDAALAAQGLDFVHDLPLVGLEAQALALQVALGAGDGAVLLALELAGSRGGLGRRRRRGGRRRRLLLAPEDHGVVRAEARADAGAGWGRRGSGGRGGRGSAEAGLTRRGASSRERGC